MSELPVHSILGKLRGILKTSRTCVVTAPPGSGKTTIIPLALIDEEWLGDKTVLLVEPRRLAARLTAGYMASLCNEKVGKTVGYHVRFDRKITEQTKVKVVTEGIFMRLLQADPELAEVGIVIFDEFHERSLEGDTALALCLDVLDALREDLRILVMSATLDTEAMSDLLGKSPVLSFQGIRFPVATFYRQPPHGTDSARSDHIAQNVADAVRFACSEHQGDILAFMPGAGEIRLASERLEPWVEANDYILLPLFGNLSLEEQSRVVQPDPRGKRRIILGTSIAETSLTIEGISIVIDSGWKRVPKFDVNSGLTRLVTVRVSRASAVQRQGRAARLGPGVCYRLWGKGTDLGLRKYDRPEILEADLAGFALQLAAWRCRDPLQLKWLDPPPEHAYNQGCSLLTKLGALDEKGNITDAGRRIEAIPLHPRLAHMLIRSDDQGCSSLAIDIASILSERDILTGHDRGADIEDRLHVLEMYRTGDRREIESMRGDIGRCRRVDTISKQLSRLFAKNTDKRELCNPGILLALAFPDQIARKKKGAASRYKLSSGKGAFLQVHDPLSRSEYLVVGAMDAGKREGRIFMAADLNKKDMIELFSSQMYTTEEVTWNNRVKAVVCRTKTQYGSLVIESQPQSNPDPGALQEALISGIKDAGMKNLPWDSASRSVQERVNCLRLWQPDEKWPDMRDTVLSDTLQEWLAPFLIGTRSAEDLQKLRMSEILLSMMDWKKQKKLEKDAPTHIAVPSGSRIKLLYKRGESPILSVRLQEMFGLAQTPTICGGRVPVLLHLLSPAHRPIQVTSDLKSFWNTSYHEVKKDLKGRYPKHYWPDDPWEAEPTRRVKPDKR